MRRPMIVVCALLLCGSALAQAGETQAPAAAHHPATQGTSDAQALWNELLGGNRQYVAGEEHFGGFREKRAQLEHEQSPDVTILACSDSRVPPELLFNQSLGKLFVIRIAGSVADDFGLASLEYAVAHDYANLLVVLGHESCGAVKAALEPEDPSTPSLLDLVSRIRTSFTGIEWKPDDPEVVRKAVEANTRASAASLPATSRLIREAIRKGDVRVVPAYYSLKTGEVKKLE